MNIGPLSLPARRADAFERGLLERAIGLTIARDASAKPSSFSGKCEQQLDREGVARIEPPLSVILIRRAHEAYPDG